MERYKTKNPLVIYLMWKGYLEDEKSKEFLEGFRFEPLHTSGHADFATLSTLIEKTNPKQVVPIHTEEPEGFQKLCGIHRALSVKDGESIVL